MPRVPQRVSLWYCVPIWVCGVLAPVASLVWALAVHDGLRFPDEHEWETTAFAVGPSLVSWSVIFFLGRVRQAPMAYMILTFLGLVASGIVLYFAHLTALRDPWGFGIVMATSMYAGIILIIVMMIAVGVQEILNCMRLGKTVCSHCHYSLAGLKSDICPECGKRAQRKGGGTPPPPGDGAR